jgi:hypothetical protein
MKPEGTQTRFGNGARPLPALGVNNPLWRLGALVSLPVSIGQVIVVSNLDPDKSLSLRRRALSCDRRGNVSVFGEGESDTLEDDPTSKVHACQRSRFRRFETWAKTNRRDRDPGLTPGSRSPRFKHGLNLLDALTDFNQARCVGLTRRDRGRRSPPPSSHPPCRRIAPARKDNVKV